MPLSKPKMRGLLATQVSRNIYISCGLGVVAAIAYKYLVMEERKKKYAEFYKTYDAETDFNRIRNLGLFNSCEADS